MFYLYCSEVIRSRITYQDWQSRVWGPSVWRNIAIGQTQTSQQTQSQLASAGKREAVWVAPNTVNPSFEQIFSGLTTAPPTRTQTQSEKCTRSYRHTRLMVCTCLQLWAANVLASLCMWCIEVNHTVLIHGKYHWRVILTLMFQFSHTQPPRFFHQTETI